MTSSLTRHLKPEDLRGRRFRGLIRESTTDQAEKWSPERQRADLLRAAEDLGLVPAAPLFYERVGSGETVGAPEVTQALTDARGGQYDVLLVLSTSRLARNREEAYRIKQEARKTGLVIFFVAERIISGSRTGRLMEGLRDVIDEEANEERRFWIAGGIRERQLSGRWTGRVPYGFRRHLAENHDGTVTPDGRLEEDPVTGPIVRRIFDEYLAGRSLRSIYLGLNSQGIANPTGSLWQLSSLRQLIANPAYKGILLRYRHRDPTHYYPENDERDGKREIPGDWPAIVRPELFDAVQVALAARQHVTNRVSNRSYPLSGILRCADCNRAMTGVSNGYSRYYRCRGKGDFGDCGARFARADTVEGSFVDWLGTYHLPDDWQRTIVPLQERAGRNEAQAKRERLTAQLVRLRQMYQWGDLPDAEYRAQVAEVRVEMALIVVPEPNQIENAAAALSDLGKTWKTLPPDGQRAGASAFLRDAMVREGEVVEWGVRAELRSLLELCCAPEAGLYLPVPRYIVRFSA